MNGAGTMLNLEVRNLEPIEYELWDKLVENSPYGTVFHKTKWLTLCKDSFNKELEIYGCFEKGELVGGCSLFINKFNCLLNIASTNCNLTPYGGILLKQSLSTRVREQESYQNNIIKTILKHIKEKKYTQVSLANSPDFIDVRQFTYDKWITDVRYAYYFDLSTNIESALSKNTRNVIRKAEKYNITVRKEYDAKLFYELFKDTFKKQGLNPPAQISFFRSALEILSVNNKGEMWIAELPSGEIASAEIILWDNKRAYRWVAASDNNLKDQGSTSLLLYNIFQELKSRNFKEINLMAANNPNLAYFISGFNPKLVPYYIVKKDSVKSKIIDKLYEIIN